MASTPRSVTYRYVDSPVGELLVAATEWGVVYLAFACEDSAKVLARLNGKIGPVSKGTSPGLTLAVTQLAEYFAGARRTFSVPIDESLTSGFRQRVQRLLSDIPYGATSTYAQLADAAANPKAVRAVGSACARNPVPIIVPCHRVLRSDGSLGGYRGGVAAKELLLRLENGALEF
ncbi:methylated-DNA--[protein]-cysteine S-methyltransferase [Corynebacterium striatum]|uniref:Methylated-DNA--protein-cysteine methyltransferase n=1 Tax=Corynebacterium striatum TaxID=43770 RepID=A0ABX7DIJ1_CORST|nr:methylated-DNA--[protein]-cysteine S-methyltransferase [Corynebacterium striatum]EGT5574617.1 methylated-DNA--[protein]-cysteine S-methyltransferase [Corynebacterium striatum]MDK8788246.1 methylated-DNA--[protein]-cysteine S-methyltransferase [Corynebacterium striatum]QQU78098.1 methylated-DNA--[protein]-cysteine S-methyltransferase [Corynebacterium striatum]